MAWSIASIFFLYANRDLGGFAFFYELPWSPSLVRGSAFPGRAAGGAAVIGWFCRRCPRWKGSCGQHGAHLGPTGPRWAPYWPHEPCYLGRLTLASEVPPPLTGFACRPNKGLQSDTIHAHITCTYRSDFVSHSSKYIYIRHWRVVHWTYHEVHNVTRTSNRQNVKSTIKWYTCN